MRSLTLLDLHTDQTPAPPARRRRRGRTIVLAVLGVFLVAGIIVYGFYRRDLRVAQASAVDASTMLQTRCGTLEYATEGAGAPVLSIHGTGGGWDQGLSIARGLTNHGYHVIAPSRFGYLRTPMPENPSPQAEADLFACFLDALNIQRVPVIAASAGAAPAIQFALRHPERVSALVLLVPGPGGFAQPDPAAATPSLIMNVVLHSNFPYWAAMKVWPRSMLTIVAVPESLVPTLAIADRTYLDQTIAQIMPVTSRRRGILYDAKTQGGTPRYPLEQVTIPTLVVSAEDDLYRTLPNARVAAAAIPGARSIEYKTGGHLLLGHGPELWPVVAEFMRRR